MTFTNLEAAADREPARRSGWCGCGRRPHPATSRNQCGDEVTSLRKAGATKLLFFPRYVLAATTLCTMPGTLTLTYKDRDNPD